RDSFRQPLSRTCALRDRELPHRQLEHEVRHPHADEAAEYLRDDVNRGRRPCHLAAQGEGKTYRRIEVRARKWAEYQDQHGEDRAGRERIAKERDCVVPCEFSRHDAGADDRCEQKGGPQPFAKCALRQRGHQLGSFAFAVAPSMRPISSSRRCKLSRSRLRIGSAVKIPMRGCSIRYASLNARAISAGEPLASTGSGMPQCAVIGWPGHTGQISPAALSQTVKAKSSGGAPGFANSFHDFERKPEVS